MQGFTALMKEPRGLKATPTEQAKNLYQARCNSMAQFLHCTQHGKHFV